MFFDLLWHPYDKKEPATAGSFRFSERSSVKAVNPMGEVFDVILRQCLSKTGHTAGIIRTLTSLEVFELRNDVLRMLARQTGDFILPFHATQMTHGTQ